MSFNASIVTDTAKEFTKRQVVDYSAGVYAHTTGDWGGHNVVRVWPLPYFDAHGDRVSSAALRLVLTKDDGSAQGIDLAFEIPVNSNGSTAITTSPPIIVTQPATTTAPPNSRVQLTVVAISDVPLTYQWQKKDGAVFNAITGATASIYVIPSAVVADTGDYHVVVTNANGSVTSTTATLTISAGASGVIDNSSFFEELPPVRLLSALFDFF